MIKAFIDNRDSNLFALHSAFARSATDIGGLFGPIYLYQHGFPLPLVFLVFGAMHVLRIPFRWMAVPLINCFGLKAALFTGGIGLGISFLALTNVKGLDEWFVCHVLLFSMFQPIYWVCYHVLYTVYGDLEKRGRQLAVRSVLDNIGKAILPIVAGYMIMLQGYLLYYSFAFFLILIGFIPFLFSSPVHMPRLEKKQLDFKKQKKNFPLFFLWAVKDTIFLQAWYFIILIAGTDNMVAFGGYVALGILAKSLWSLLLGHWVDLGKGQRVNNIAGLSYGAAVLAKALAPVMPFYIATIETFSSFAFIMRGAIGGTVMYNKGKTDKQVFWYWMVLEMAWDVGVAVGAILLASGTFWGVSLQNLVILALPFVVLWWLYVRRQLA